jgi:quinoprotein glucose dehydrogenase
MSREFFRSASGSPCTAPPWGELVAVSANTGDIAWRAPFSPNLGGPATTDTGLVFIGATVEPYLRAFETRTGRELWKGQLPTSARATPLIYTTERGRQMVAIAAGGHDTSQSKLDTKLVVFSLRDTR